MLDDFYHIRNISVCICIEFYCVSGNFYGNFDGYFLTSCQRASCVINNDM